MSRLNRNRATVSGLPSDPASDTRKQILIPIAAVLIYCLTNFWINGPCLAQSNTRPESERVNGPYSPIAALQLDCTPLSIQFLESSNSVAVGGSDGQIYICRVPDLKVASIIPVHELGVRSIDFCENDETLRSSSYDNIATIHKEGDHWRVKRTAMSEPVAEVFVRPGHTLGLSIVSYSTRIHVASRHETRAVATAQHMIRTGSYSDCGQHLCFGDRRGNILLVAAEDANDFTKYRSHPVHQRTVRSVESIPGTSKFVSCGEDGNLAIVDGEQNSAETLIDRLPTKLVSCIGITQQTLATGGTNNRIYVIDIASRRITQVLSRHRGTVVGLASNHQMLASIGFDSKVILWSRQKKRTTGISDLARTGSHVDN